MHRHAKWFAPVVAVLFGLAACEDPTTPPPGTLADVTVRAYVDADGSGDFSAGDPVVSGASVTLTPTEGGQTLTATTDDSGVAQFSAVPPGSYVATLEGNVPAGAAISGPERPVVVVPFQGGQIETEFRYVFHPGTITGVVFRDDDGSGEYNPDEDTPAAGVEVRLHRGTGLTDEPLATTLTDTDGRFHFETLRPGTYTIEIIPLETIEIVGEPVFQVTVHAEAETEVFVEFVGDLLITIEEARARDDGASVEVEGVVLADQGTYDFGNRDTYIQDSTAGIRLWQLDTDLGLQVGDSIRVSGQMDTFNDERQITVSAVTVLGTGTVPQPRLVTGAEINSFEFDGELGVTGPVTVISVAVFSFDAHSVTVEDEDGTRFVVRMDSPNEIPSDYWQEGEIYVVTGVLARFRNTGQIKPRGFDDVVEMGAIAEARAAADGERVLVEGVVLADQGTYDFGNRDTYIQDSTAGIRLWQLDTELGLEVGDSVRISGRMDTFNSERQITVATATVLGTGTVPEPREVTGAEINSFEFDGELAVTGPVTVISVQVFSFDAHNVTVEHEDGTRFVVRIDSPNEIPSSYWQEGETYRITGVLARFRDTGQIKPRGFDDVEEL